MEFIIDENGNVLSCALIDYGKKLSLTNSEIECILSSGMNTKFNFIKKPSNVSHFFAKIKKRYIQ